MLELLADTVEGPETLDYRRLLGGAAWNDLPVATRDRFARHFATGGSRWIRRYTFPDRLVEIASVKAVDGDGFLVERLAMGLRMQLQIFVLDRDLHFREHGLLRHV